MTRTNREVSTRFLSKELRGARPIRAISTGNPQAKSLESKYLGNSLVAPLGTDDLTESKPWDLQVLILHYGYMASAIMTPVLREAMLFLFEPRRLVASSYSKLCPVEFVGIF